MQAYHNDPAIKATYLARVRTHPAADELIHGQYWQNGKGCAVGCTIHGSEHARYEIELGIPRILARLEDRFFELMSNGDAQAWPERFLEAIPVGADLSGVWPRFALWLLADETHGVRQYAKTQRTRAAIDSVVGLYERVAAGGSVARGEWLAVRSAAYAAAAYTAYAAYAAYARKRHTVAGSERLLVLLGDAPVLTEAAT